MEAAFNQDEGSVSDVIKVMDTSTYSYKYYIVKTTKKTEKDSDELDSEELSDELDDLEELDDELVAYCDKMLAKLLSLILTLAFSSVSAITWFWKFVSFWYCAIMIFFNSFL